MYASQLQDKWHISGNSSDNDNFDTLALDNTSNDVRSGRGMYIFAD